MRRRILILTVFIFGGLLGACQAQGQEVQTRLSEVESQLDTLAADAANEQSQVFQVTIAIYLLDTAGFHAMDESINENGTIDPQFLGTVRNVDRILAATAWPAELQDDVTALRDTLSTFATALEDDDVDAAGPAAGQAHEQQHDLSHSVEEWLSGQGIGDAGGHD